MRAGRIIGHGSTEDRHDIRQTKNRRKLGRTNRASLAAAEKGENLRKTDLLTNVQIHSLLKSVNHLSIVEPGTGTIIRVVRKMHGHLYHQSVFSLGTRVSMSTMTAKARI